MYNKSGVCNGVMQKWCWSNYYRPYQQWWKMLSLILFN